MVRTTGNRDLLVTPGQLDEMLERAGEKGALAALKQIGLSDEHAGRDIKEVRNILDGFRFARRTIFETALRWATIGIVGLIVLGSVAFFNSGK